MRIEKQTQTSRNVLIHAAVLAVPLFVYLTSTSSAQQPNVLVILADDLGYSDLGCYGVKFPRLILMHWQLVGLV